MEEFEDPISLCSNDDLDDDDDEDVMEVELPPLVDFSGLDELFLPEEEPEESVNTNIKAIVGITPIVYTTKLEDMNIFKTNFKADSIKDITNKIVLESKPKLRRLAKYKIMKNNDSYQNMMKKLNTINQKIRLETEQQQKHIHTNLEADVAQTARKRDEELLQMCKPVSIVLEDIKHTIPFLFGPAQIRIEESSKNGSYIFSSDDDESLCEIESNVEKTFPILPQHKPQTIRKKSSIKNNCEIKYTSLKENIKNVFFLFYNKSIHELDIYYINSNAVVTEHNTLKGSRESFEDKTLYPFVGQREAIKLEFCCWYKRDEFIKLMWPKIITLSISRFMRKSHPCVPGKCACCCGKSNNETGSNTVITRRVMPSASKNDGLNIKVEKAHFKSEKPIEDDDIEDLEQEISNTIFEIQEKIASPDEMQEENASKDTGKETNGNFWHKYLLMTSCSSTLIDKALRYTRKKEKPVHKRKWTFEPSTLIKMGNRKFDNVDCYELSKHGEVIAYSKQNGNVCPIHTHTNLQAVSYTNVCCWHSRERTIANMCAGNSDNNNALNFMRLPHKCLPGYCRCCCQKINPKTNEKMLPLISIPISEHDKRFTFKTTVNTTATQLATPKPILTTPTPEPTINIPTPKPITTIPTPLSDLPNAPILEKALINNPLKPSSVTSQALEIDSMVSTILNRFKDVRLSITEDGKVSASLNIPVNTLNSVELKVLSQILTHAQEQINALGLKPGANLTNIANSATQNQEQVEAVALGAGINLTNITKSASQNTDKNNQTGINAYSIGTESLEAELAKVAPKNSADVSLNNKTASNLNQQVKLISVTHQDPPPLLSKKATSPYDYYSKLMGIKCQAYSESLKSHIKTNSEREEMSTPIIENVFSLSEMDLKGNILSDNNLKKTVSGKESKNMSGRRNKRKNVDKSISTKTKIRVKSPSKLGISDNVQQIVKQQSVCNPVSTTSSVAKITVCGGTIQLIPEPAQITAGQINLTPQPTQINTGNIMFQEVVQNNLSLDAQTDSSPLVEQTDFEDAVIPGFVIAKPDNISHPPRLAPMQLQTKVNQQSVDQISSQKASVVTVPVFNNAVQDVGVFNSTTIAQSPLLQQLIQKPAQPPKYRPIAPKLSNNIINTSPNTMTMMNSAIPTLVIEIDEDDDDNEIKNECDDLFREEETCVTGRNITDMLTNDAEGYQDITSANIEDDILAEDAIEGSQIIGDNADNIQDPLFEDPSKTPEERDLLADIQLIGTNKDAGDEDQCILGF